MAMEIERKFLVNVTKLKDVVKRGELSAGAGIIKAEIEQGYLTVAKGNTVRIRITKALGQTFAHLCIKGGGKGISTQEFEYDVPVIDAKKMMALCGSFTLKKDRWEIPAENNLKWEVDFFKGPLKGLVVAEIELPSEDAAFFKQSWLRREVSHLKEYKNKRLVQTQMIPDNFFLKG